MYHEVGSYVCVQEVGLVILAVGVRGTVTVRASFRVRVTVSVRVTVRARVTLIATHKGKAGDIIAHEFKVRGFDGDTVTAEVIICQRSGLMCIGARCSLKLRLKLGVKARNGVRATALSPNCTSKLTTVLLGFSA